MTGRLQNCSRRLIACAMAYAFALQGFIFALDIGNSAFAAVNDTAWAGFELCVHSGAVPTVPGVPDQGPVGHAHCVYCIVGTVFLNATPAAAPNVHQVLLADGVTALAAGRLVPPNVSQSAWPRGPPV